MTAEQSDDDSIPVLTDIVLSGSAAEPLPQAALSAAQAELTARVLKLTEELAHSAAREMEAVLLERLCDALREQLPALIDETLRSALQQTEPPDA